MPLLLIAVILIDQVRTEDEPTVQVVKKVKKKTKKVSKLKPKAVAKAPRERPQADAPPAYPEYDNYDSYDYAEGERDYDADNGKVMGEIDHEQALSIGYVPLHKLYVHCSATSTF